MNKFFLAAVFSMVILLSACTKEKDVETYAKINPDDILSANINGVDTKYHKYSAKALMREYKNLSDKDANEFVLNVKENPDKTEPFYYAAIAEDIFEKDKKNAAIMFLYAQFRSAQDAACCLDETSFDFVNELPIYAPNVSKYLLNVSKDTYKNLFNEMLKLDDKYKERVSPIWACYNGLDAVEKDEISTVPKKDWANKRQNARADYIIQANRNK